MLNSEQKHALLFLVVFAIGCIAYFWYVDRQRTTERVTNLLRPEIQAQVERENTLTLDYAEALYTNQLIWQIQNNTEQTTEESFTEQLFENVFQLSNMRKTRYWKHKNFDPKNVMVGALDLLDIRTADEFAKRFKSSETYQEYSSLLDAQYPNWFDELKNHVAEVLFESGRGYPEND